MANSVLLIGGTGLLSTAVLKRAINKNYSISVFNRGNKNKSLPENVKVYKGDFYKSESVKTILKDANFDIIVDFLSRNPSDIERVFPILKDKCVQYIFISSSCVYRRDKVDLPIKESSPKPNREWEYNIQKYNCEKLLAKLCEHASCYYTIIRPYITYDNGRIPFGLAPSYKYHRTILERIRNDKPMFMWGGCNTITTTVTYSMDFAKGVVGLFLNENAKNEDFHITSDKYYKCEDILSVLYDILNKKPQIVKFTNDEIIKVFPNYKDMLIGDRSLDAIFDNTKIKQAVQGLTFDTSLKEGLHNIVNYYDSSQEYIYDYVYDAQIDRLMATKKIKTRYIAYKQDSHNHLKRYYAYRYFPYNIATKIVKIFRFK